MLKKTTLKENEFYITKHGHMIVQLTAKRKYYYKRDYYTWYVTIISREDDLKPQQPLILSQKYNVGDKIKIDYMDVFLDYFVLLNEYKPLEEITEL